MSAVSDSGSAESSVFYTTHHNWEWVVDEAVMTIFSRSKKCTTFKELASQQNRPKSKPSYALFRVESEHPKASCWADGKCFEFLDAKNSLFDHLQHRGAQDTMPLTRLIPWDVHMEFEVGLLPSQPCLLKAACGSGGYGIYFVNNEEDAKRIIVAHAKRANSFDNFVENMRKDFGGQIPQWSLQQLLQSVKVKDNLRCQIRVYVITCGDRLYMYTDQEVRIPSWGNKDVDKMFAILAEEYDENAGADNLSDLELFEIECCKGGTARPYNRDRVKAETMRYMLEEIEEVAHMHAAIADCVRTAMVALQPSIMAHMGDQGDAGASGVDAEDTAKDSSDETIHMAIAGIDLLLSDDEVRRPNEGLDGSQMVLVPKILELNNNPAMASPGKLMSDKYRSHLVLLVTRIMELGLSGGLHHPAFERLW